MGLYNNVETILTVTYNRDITELKKVKCLKIEYIAGTNKGSLVENYDSDSPLDRKTFSLKGGSSGGGLTPKDIIVTVKVTIDNKEQTFELKKVN